LELAGGDRDEPQGAEDGDEDGAVLVTVFSCPHQGLFMVGYPTGGRGTTMIARS